MVNQDTSGAKKAAAAGPVYITDRGRPSHVLLTYEDYERLVGGKTMIELLGEPDGVEDIHFDPPTARDVAVPSHFD